MTNLVLKQPELLRQACLIDGQWRQASSGGTLCVTNPFDGQMIGTVPSLAASEVTSAVTSAHQAQPAWAKLTAKARATLLHRWADLIDEHTEDLAQIMTAEQGKPLTESRGEIAYANSFVRWFAEEGRRAYGDVITANQAEVRHVVIKQPVGVCAAITPWNFPAAMMTRKVAPALAAGCTIVVKPASQTPFSALALAYLAQQAGLPDGVLSVVTGSAAVVAEVLTQDERIAKLSFTGSTAVGKTLMAQCAGTLKRLSLELGGNAPFIVFADADLDKAVEGLVASKYRNAGQTCVCANRVYVHKDVKEAFIKKLVAKVAILTVGNGADEGTQIAPLIDSSAIEQAQRLLKDATDKGAVIATGGQIDERCPQLMTPAVVDNVSDDMLMAQTEIFAPIAPILSFEGEAEVIQRANSTPYGLAAYFYTQDLARSWRVAEALEFGMVAQNTGLLSTEVAPFGGIKQSGFGREGSKYGIDEYLSIKYWNVQL
ncbi:MAG: NAD-dependent succinate-semialdehyde dehydrogenase [Moraxella sp.]|nr:NAD-dependent succinate-semialdehyde dehydrogenase [Moraxella sp.]